MTKHPITLRWWNLDDKDAASILAMAQDADGWRNILDPDLWKPKTLGEACALIETMNTTPWCFAVDMAGTAVGSVVLIQDKLYRARTVEIGVWLLPPLRGHKIYKEVWPLILEECKKREIARIEARPWEWSRVSIGMMEKLGFVLEGRLRHASMHEGRLVDELMYAYVLE